MNLTIIEKQAFEKMPVGLRDYARDRINRPIKELSDRELSSECAKIIGMFYLEQNQLNVETEIINFQRDSLIGELTGRFRELTIPELQKAFKAGVRGETGPFFGGCAKTYHQFIKHYYERPERVKAMQEYLALVETSEKKEITPEEKREKSKQACIAYFNEYKNTGKLGSGSYTFYDSFWNFGLLKFSAEEKQAIRDKVNTEYTQTLNTSKKRGQISSNQLAELLLSFDTNPTVKGNLRKEALTRYFNKLIRESINLEEVLKTN